MGAPQKLPRGDPWPPDRTIAQGFAEISAIAGYVVYACSILPEHIHMVIRRHDYVIEQVVARLKGKATER